MHKKTEEQKFDIGNKQQHYLKQERIKTFSLEFPPSRYLNHIIFIFNRVPQHTNKRLPHVSIK